MNALRVVFALTVPSALTAVLALTGSARAETGEPAPLVWDESFTRVGTVDYVVIGASLGVIGAAILVGPDPHAPVIDRVAFDDAARDLLRAPTARGRLWARDGSDVLAATLVSYPILVEGIANAGFARRSPDVARELVLIDLEAQLLAAALTGVGKAFFSRERAFGRECGGDLPFETFDCVDDDRYNSFPSGHASGSFAAASVVCVQNQYLPLWPTPWLPCAVGYTAASAAAGLRIVADRHYVTDVLAGAVLGTAAGLTVPLLHFEGVLSGSGSDRSLALVPAPGGLSVVGVF